MTTADGHNARFGEEQHESGLPFALLVHEGGDVDTFIASATVQGDTLILELDDGRRIEMDRRELLDRVAA